eukprot:2053127-Pyramimonas_sp.AAC.1
MKRRVEVNAEHLDSAMLTSHEKLMDLATAKRCRTPLRREADRELGSRILPPFDAAREEHAIGVQTLYFPLEILK